MSAPSAAQLREALGARGSAARCPAHDDEHGSLSISEGRNGAALVKCHAGCSQDAVIDALRARGIWPAAERRGFTVAELAAAKQLPESLLRESGFTDEEQRGCSVIRMDYRSADGEILCVRYRGALAANGSDRRFWFRRGDKQQLFGLWRLRPEPVILVEGETDSLALWAAGFNALGVPGAEAWRDDRFAPALEQCPTIYVHVELDAGGEKFRAALERSRLRERVRFFTVARNAKDPCELRARDPDGFRAALEPLLESAQAAGRPSEKPAAGPAPDQAADVGPDAREDDRHERGNLRLQPLAEFIERPKVSSHVRGVLPAGALVVVFGPPKGGKTFSVCDLVMHAAHGLDWHGCTVSRPLRVVYLAGEGVNGLRVRLKAWLEYHDTVSQKPVFEVLPLAFSLCGRALDLIEALRSIAPDVIVTDTLNAYFGGGDENATQDMTAWCAAARAVRDALGSTIVIVHHTGHGDSGRERGSIVLRATADVLIQVAKDEATQELVGFQVIAARDIESMEEPIALKLVRHETEWLDEDGERLVTCVVTGADRAVTLPGRGGRPLGDAQAAVLQAAQDLAKTQTPDSAGNVLLARHEVAQLAKDRANLSRQSVSSTWAPLARRGLVKLIEPGSLSLRVRT